ncbi:KAP family P-loop domain protein (plasmid) [Corynebacterium occultum]|uniref:KAP family P-loop domain protein n=1 Tax=Corynebacterium occultum TaxID=2675219 RepID=A0A6B8WD03_9CORY|nr:KAP family NTPase [Corynebacterium occultum]QGU08746.1 KAP family P-loop domain protein [Corynebacterium occultum]
MPTIWSDAPIKSADEDSFGRSPYAKQIAHLVQGAHSWEDSIVFGLTGPWGSGKSSMLAMIEEQLTSSENEWHIARFTPWATSDINGLLGDFYASLSSALPSERGKDLREKLGTILQISAPAAKMIPLFGDAAAMAAEKAGERLQKQPSWSQAFKEASDELKNLDIPVLVIADDIDRLHGEELLALLKVVRLLGRFPGVHFLLAYDEQTVTETLSETGIAGKGTAAGRKFLEKIVQYPLAIPPLVPTQLRTRIDEGLEPFITRLEQPEMFAMRLQGLRRVLLSQLSTPRAIDRYIAQVRHHLAMFDSQEVQVEDVIVVTLLKTSFPSLYNQLPRYKDQLITGMQDGLGRGFYDADRKTFDPDPLFDGIPPQECPDARTLLEELFPGVRGKRSYYFSRPEERSIYDKRYFDRYFAMGVPAHDISDTAVANAITAAADGNESPLKELLLDEDSNRISMAIDKAETSTDLLGEDAERLAVLRTIIPLLGSLSRHDTALLSADKRIREWSGKMLSRLSDDVEVSKLVDALNLSPHHLDQVHILQFMLLYNGHHRWVDEVLDQVCQHLVEVIMSNLRDQDEASLDDQVEFMIFVLREWKQQEFLVEPLRAGLAEGAFTVEDVAARCVTYSRSLGGEQTVTKLHDFNREAFDEIVPDADPSWSSTPRSNVDEYDLSWKNRRDFAVAKAPGGEKASPD